MKGSFWRDRDPAVRLTARSLIAGYVLSILMCGMNSYLTLSFGVIEEGPTIAALFFFAFFFLSRTKITTTELTMVATIGSAGGSLGFIANFYAAKVMIGEPYSFWEMTAFSIVTSLVGLMFVIPLRELLILKEDLPWVGSKAVHSVINALCTQGDKKQPAYLFVTVALAMAYVIANDDGGFGIVPEGAAITLFGLSAYGAAVSWSPFAIGGAYLMGMRTCVGFLVGGLILLVLAPNLAEPAAPHRYIWPGMGFLLASGLTVLAVNWRVVVAAMRSIFALGGSTPDDDPILVGKAYAIFCLVVLLLTCVFGSLVMGLNLILLFVLIVLGGLIQNIIATRAAAQTAFNPARAMGALLQGACAAVGGSSADLNLTGAGFVAGSGAQAGNLTADMAYGRWLKVPSRWQFVAQTLTVVPCSLVAAWVFSEIHRTRTISLEGGSLPAPVAKMWATTALIFDGRREMPEFAVQAMLIGAAIGTVYVLLEQLPKLRGYLPDSTGIGLGLVLPIAIDNAFFLGGVLMWILLGKLLKVKDLSLTTIAVGCIVGEGIGGVAKPLFSLLGVIPQV